MIFCVRNVNGIAERQSAANRNSLRHLSRVLYVYIKLLYSTAQCGRNLINS